MPTRNVTDTEVSPNPLVGSGGGTRNVTNTEISPTILFTASPTTNAATLVTGSGATLNGTLTDEGILGVACNCGFQWGTTVAYGNTTATQSRTTGQVFAVSVTLLPNTTYHFRAFATNALGTGYGADVQFTTPIITPIVATLRASNVGLSQATLNGFLTNDGGTPCNVCFEWGTTLAYGNVTPVQLVSIGQSFSAVIVNLVPSTIYHFRAVASNGF